MSTDFIRGLEMMTEGTSFEVAPRGTLARVAELEMWLDLSTRLLVEAGCFERGESAPRDGCDCETCAQVRENRAALATKLGGGT